MKTFLAVGLAIAAFIVSPLQPHSALAQEPVITASSEAPVPLLVDGIAIQQLPVTIQPGARICIAQTVSYTSTSERWTFEGWSHGPNSGCVTVAAPGPYIALYAHEVLLHIRSAVSETQESRWVSSGEPVTVEVPAIATEAEGIRYRFVEWGDGETPFRPQNVIAPLTPLTLEPTWIKEYLVTVEGPEGALIQGSGWYTDGANVVLQAPDVITTKTLGEREKFTSWEVIGPASVTLSNASVSRTTAPASAPFTATAVYDTEFFVLAQTPYGTLHSSWMKRGDELLLEAFPVEEIVPEERRLVFRRWDGQGMDLTSPRITGTINGVTTLMAVYDTEVMVVVNAPLGGSGGGWHKVGSTIRVAVPESAQSHLVFRKSFAGFPGHTNERSSFDLMVQEPVVITALYNDGVNTGTVALLLFLPFLAALGVLLSKRAGRWIHRPGLGPE